MEPRKDAELLLPAAAVAGRTWQRFLLRMPVLDAANTSPLIEELGGEVVRNLYRRPAPGIWKSAPRNFWPFAVFCMFMSGLCVPPFARIAKFQKDSALFFSFALQLTVVIMYLPRLGLILRTRRGPWQTYLLLGAFWCCSVLLKSRAYGRLPIAFCFLVSNIRMPLGLVLRVCFCGKQYTPVQYLGASMIATSVLLVCVKSALTADMEVFVDGLCRLLTATLLQTVELRLMRNFIQRYGGSIQEYTLFTHLFALTILFPPFWQSISHHIHICLSDKDHWLSSRLASGVVLHFFARGLASALASRSPTVQLAQMVQGFAGMCQVFVALWCSESTPDASLCIMAAVAVAIGNLLYLSNVENAEENCSSPALGKMLEMESPALKQVWAEATLEAKQGNEEAIRRENLAWRRIGLQGLKQRRRQQASEAGLVRELSTAGAGVEIEIQATLEDLAPVPQEQQKLPCLLERALQREQNENAPPFLPVAISYIIVGTSVVWPYSKLLQRDPKSALCFNFILHVVILARFIPRASSLLQHRQIPLRLHALMAFLWCSFTVLKSDAFSRLPTSVCFLLSNLRMMVGLVIQFLLFGKRYSSSQVLGAAIVTVGIAWAGDAMQHAAASKNSGSGVANHDFFIGCLECLVSTTALALQGCSIKMVFSRYGEHVEEQVFFTHLCALIVVFPSQWHLVGPRLLEWFQQRDPSLLVLVTSGVCLNFASRNLGTKLAGRAPNLLVLQLAQTLDGFGQLLVAALVRVPPWPPSGFWGGALVLLLGTLQYLRASGAATKQKDTIPAEVWKTPNSQAAWSLATVAARGGGADALRRENLNWRRLNLVRVKDGMSV